MRENQTQQAESYFKSLVNISPEKSDGYYRLGLINQEQQNFDAAMRNFEIALSKNPENIDIFIHLISLLLKKDQIETAIQKCELRLKEMENNPRDRAVIYNLKGKLQLAKDQPTQAEKAFKTAIIESPNYLPAYYSLARLYLTENRTEEAIQQYQRAIDKGGRDDMPHMMLGIIFSAQEKTDMAEYHYRKALEENPDFVPAANNLAYLLAETGKNLNEAMRLAETAKRQLPNDPKVQDTLGWVYVKMGLYDNAIREFTQSIEQLPDNPTIYYHLGVAYHKKGETGQAKDALKAAIKMDPNFSEADHARRILSTF